MQDLGDRALSDLARLNPAAFLDFMRDAYRAGAFPMHDPDAGRINFYTADPRGVLPLREAEGFRVPSGVARDIRSRRFTLSADTAFERVMRLCAQPRKPSPSAQSEGTWISDDLIAWYTTLHELGAAHSVEAWRNDPASGERVLVGGVYGVSFGRAFFAESMFHIPRPRLPDGSRDPLDGSGASSVCLVALIRHLDRCGYGFCDTQIVTPHIARFGARPTPKRDFDRMLASATRDDEPGRFGLHPLAPP